MSLPTQAHRFLKIITALGEDAVIAVRANGVEALGRMFEVNVEFTAARDDLDLDSLLGTSVTIEVDMSGERSRATTANARYFNGFFSRITYGGFQTEGRPVFRATIVPWLWFLTRRSDCRIFQQKSVREIIEQVFSDAGFSDYRFDLKGSYPTINYCVQYRESDFQFVSRLMEREGIYYHFTHKDGYHQMQICDDMSCHKPEENFETLSFIGGSAVTDREGVVQDWEYTREVKPGAYAHNDFNFLTPTPDPNLRLLARSTAPKQQKPQAFEIYDAPGGFGDTGEGGRYARIRMEELLADRDVATARTNIQGVCAGRKIKLAKHPTKKQNRGYLVTSVQWSVHEGGYGSGGGGGGEFFQCAFTCIPDDGVFRAARITPSPRIDGPQTATVCGPKGQEIYVDEHARVKVQFHWDRHGKLDAASSCWVRVSQPWAGKGFGGMAIPRNGHEVIVEFIEGDPDRPIITGRVYNASNMPNASNAGRDGKPGNSAPADIIQAAMMTSMKSDSLGGSGGFNEITMNDTGGAEGLFIRAQKDEIHLVLNDREDTVGNDETRTVGNNRSRQVSVDESVTVGNNRTVTVGSDHTENIGANQVLNVGADQDLVVGGSRNVSVGGNQSTRVGGTVKLDVGQSSSASVAGDSALAVGGVHEVTAGAGIRLTATAFIEFVVGGSSIKFTPGSIVIQSAGPVTVKGAVVKVNG